VVGSVAGRRVMVTGGAGFLDTGLPRVVADQPVEALRLQCEQIGNRQGVRDFGEREPRCDSAVLE